MKIFLVLLLTLYCTLAWSQEDTSADEAPAATEESASDKTSEEGTSTEEASSGQKSKADEANPSGESEGEVKASDEEKPKKKKRKKRRKKRKKKKAAEEESGEVESGETEAGEEGAKEETFTVQWFQPEYEVYEPKNKKKRKRNYKRYQVTFLGKTDPGAKVKVGRTIYRVVGKKVKKLSSRKLMQRKSVEIKVEEDGVFKIPMVVPYGNIQIPIAVKKGKTIKKMQLIATVNQEKIVVKDAEILYTACETCVWLGLGFGVLNYQQDPPQDLKPIDYGSLTLPNISVRGSVKLTSKWNLRFDMHSLTGQDLSSNDAQVSILSKTIAWTYYGLEAEYKAFSKGTLMGYASQPSVVFGVQAQNMPFVAVTTSPNFTIGTFSFNSLSLGGVILFNAHKRWQYEVFMRAQMALSGSGDVTLDSGFAFDGSVGTIYNMTKKLKLGIFWNGQYHTYSYSIAGSPGTYSLLASQFDFSLGYQF